MLGNQEYINSRGKLNIDAIQMLAGQVFKSLILRYCFILHPIKSKHPKSITN